MNGMNYLLLIIVFGVICSFSYIFLNEEFSTGLLTACVGIFGLIYSNDLNKKKEIEARLFQQKAEVYEEIFTFIKVFFERFKNKEFNSKTDKDIIKKLNDIKYKLLVWGSDETILAWMNAETIKAETPKEIFKPWAELYFCMRKDLGHEDKKIEAMHLIAIHLDANGKKEILG